MRSLAPLAAISAKARTSLVGAHAAAPSVGPHLGRAVALSLPLNAGTGTPIIVSATCVQTGSCTLGGLYSDSSNAEQAMAVSLQARRDVHRVGQLSRQIRQHVRDDRHQIGVYVGRR